jgi:hypothetical protein
LLFGEDRRLLFGALSFRALGCFSPCSLPGGALAFGSFGGFSFGLFPPGTLGCLSLEPLLFGEGGRLLFGALTFGSFNGFPFCGVGRLPLDALSLTAFPLRLLNAGTLGSLSIGLFLCDSLALDPLSFPFGSFSFESLSLEPFPLDPFSLEPFSLDPLPLDPLLLESLSLDALSVEAFHRLALKPDALGRLALESLLLGERGRRPLGTLSFRVLGNLSFLPFSLRPRFGLALRGLALDPLLLGACLRLLLRPLAIRTFSFGAGDRFHPCHRGTLRGDAGRCLSLRAPTFGDFDGLSPGSRSCKGFELSLVGSSRLVEEPGVGRMDRRFQRLDDDRRASQRDRQLVGPRASGGIVTQRPFRDRGAWPLPKEGAPFAVGAGERLCGHRSHEPHQLTDVIGG